MRAAVFLAVVLLSACASDRLQLTPSHAVDFSGKWKLDEADSDDPQHLLQAASPRNPQGTQGADRSSGRGQQRAGRLPPGVAGGPAVPPVGAMGAPLRWPGKRLEIKQVGGVVAFTSEGRNRVCQPGTEHKPRPKPDPRDREALGSGHDAPAPDCGWDEAILVIKGGDPDEDKPTYEEHYSLSDDRQRLIEEVVFTRGRASGFTLSRVWQRVTE